MLFINTLRSACPLFVLDYNVYVLRSHPYCDEKLFVFLEISQNVILMFTLDYCNVLSKFIKQFLRERVTNIHKLLQTFSFIILVKLFIHKGIKD